MRQDLILVVNQHSGSSATRDPSPSNNLLKKLCKKVSMRRVTSRQRLCSWDAFDAVSVVSLDSDCDDLPRKNSRRSLAVPAGCVSKVSEDVMLLIASFLEPQDACAWTQTDRASLDILDSDVLWHAFLQRQWPFMTWHNSRLVNQLHSNKSEKSTSRPEYPTILRYACNQQSTCVDESTFVHARLSRRTLTPVVQRHTLLATATTEPVLQTRSLSDGSKAVQYTGPIGQGDRSIRANQPLARPTEALQPRRRFSIRATICRTLSLTDCQWRPFTSPFYQADKSINVTPRLVSYYEVSILADTLPSRDALDGITSPAVSEECVAVGLAGSKFYCTTRMPGWDRHSFGYHGDDGGFFHGSGSMRLQYGPKFGRGDTVGCGVDYLNNTIFFTLNGKSLGTAMECVFDDYAEHVGLYPVVGLDSSSLVQCNFVGPFQFDLAEHIYKQANTIQQAMRQKKIVF